ncbi:MAG: FkbM family methyltransferase [Bacteroidetes bacterium]|nr:FkbM family methyltransferase [Bacteroidota bacterium]
MGSPVVSGLKKIIANTFFPHVRRSYSQSGEDIIISDLFGRLGIQQPSYLDIGANAPVALNNTYRLYARGSNGVCIEPNPVLYEKLKQKRKRDICINAGIAFDENRQADFYLFTGKAHGLSTFSKQEADFWEKTGNEEIGRHKPASIIKTQLLDINEVMRNYFFPHPNLISIDVEGLDLQIAKTIDFEQYKPEVICAETLWFAENNKETKNYQLIEFYKDRGYFVYADTYINSIFCRKDAYKNISF